MEQQPIFLSIISDAVCLLPSPPSPSGCLYKIGKPDQRFLVVTRSRDSKGKAMFKTMMKYSLALVVCLVAIKTANAALEIPKTTTHIILNSTPTLVFFNDGDTFKIMDGALKNSRVRIAGFNTLETYGPVHQWNNNSPHYLFTVANEATRLAQNGHWNCKTEGGRDVYDRLLAICDDLALALIDAGLAHAYSVDHSSAHKDYLTSQQEAMTKRIGMWKHGVPNFIIASLHSINEGVDEPYNRLISTMDGHSEKWSHREGYGTCENVCLGQEASCMVYVPFAQRYGSARPECLRQKEILWEL